MPANLPHRIEEVGAEQERALLEEAFFALNPSPRFEPDWYCTGNMFREWQDKEIAFKRMLDASAWESAAMMLIPDDCLHLVRTIWDNDQRVGFASISRYRTDQGRKYWTDEYQATAATPALALLAAILRTQEPSE